ncbi:MAG: hypothetical protein QW137_09935 [Candidatus Caldarchaeum sp.]
MSEDFRWVDPRVYYSWVGSFHYRQLRDFDGHTLPQPTPATLPFLPAEFHRHPATMNPWLASWIFRRYLQLQRVVVEPMAGVGGTGM